MMMMMVVIPLLCLPGPFGRACASPLPGEGCDVREIRAAQCDQGEEKGYIGKKWEY